MLGTIVNCITIIAGSTIGYFVKKGIKPQYQKALFTTMGLAALCLGLSAVCQHLPKSQHPVLFIVSLAVGGLLGTMLNLEGRLKGLMTHYSTSDLAQGLSTAVLLFCIGTLSIVGPMMSALYGDNTYLLTNATLDFVTSAVLASSYGIGIVLAAPILFCWQGGIYLFSYLVGDMIPQALITEISIVGGVLIAASGLSILEVKDCKTTNLLPALLIPILYFGIMKTFG